jgi:hypothetical protein
MLDLVLLVAIQSHPIACREVTRRIDSKQQVADMTNMQLLAVNDDLTGCIASTDPIEAASTLDIRLWVNTELRIRAMEFITKKKMLDEFMTQPRQ